MPESPTHILYIAEFSTGGSIESLFCLVSGLDKQTFRATVLFYNMPDRAMRERFENAGATVVSLFPHKSGKGSRRQMKKHNMQSRVRTLFGRHVERFYESLKFGVEFLRFQLPIYRAIRHQIGLIRPDLVHLNNGARTDTAGVLAARAHKVPAVCHVRTFGKVSHLGVIAVRSVKVFLCISTAVRQQLVDYGVEAERCIVVPNAVDPVRFNESAISTEGIRREFGWDRSHKVFALVGRVVSWKGQDYFIEAIAEARRTNPMIRGLIVGTGEESSSNESYVNKLKSLIREHDLDDSVRFTGHRTDIPNIMKSSDAVVCASSSPEPFGRVIIEGMAVGSPAVATNAGGATDIIEDNENGLLVPIKDSAALADAILRLSQDETLVQNLRRAAMQTVADRYTVERHVARICDVYRSQLDLRQKESTE